jgi:poly-gamma-glutamate capsule biosynthesis protein CapA/YwtB (metallophosphatase superfamily)
VVVDEQRIKNVISEAEKEVDYLVVLMSWGIEYRNIANQHQQRMAHLMMDNGADLIVASHPHWVQNLEIYTPEVGPNKGEKLPIFYSLGNFIFDQTHTDPTRQGIVVNAYYYENKLKSFEIIPHLTCGYHQSNNNLANQVISGEMTYEQVDAMDERDGCIYWQPKPLEQTRQEYKEIWDRFMEGTEI